jgi:hypothetical protein
MRREEVVRGEEWTLTWIDAEARRAVGTAVYFLEWQNVQRLRRPLQPAITGDEVEVD